MSRQSGAKKAKPRYLRRALRLGLAVAPAFLSVALITLTGPRMPPAHRPKPAGPDFQEDRSRYLSGAVVTIALTLCAFGIVWSGVLQGTDALIAVALLAVVQMASHLYFFMHIDLRRSHRDDLMLVLFTVLIVALMVGGTLWILFDLWSRMG